MKGINVALITLLASGLTLASAQTTQQPVSAQATTASTVNRQPLPHYPGPFVPKVPNRTALLPGPYGCANWQECRPGHPRWPSKDQWFGQIPNPLKLAQQNIQEYLETQRVNSQIATLRYKDECAGCGVNPKWFHEG